MRKISLYLMLLTSAAFIASCDKSKNVQLHTIINEDGSCERHVSYSNVMTKTERDSLWAGDNVQWAYPLPECLNIDAFMDSHTDIGEGDTVTTTFRSMFNSVEEMCQRTPLNLNGSRIKSKASLEKHFCWLYTEYTYTETFISVEDSFKLPVANYADKDVISYWFTGKPNLMQGLTGSEVSQRISKMEEQVDQWFNDNFYQSVFEYMVDNYDSIPNPPISKERFVALRDSFYHYIIGKSEMMVLNLEIQDNYREFYHSNAYADFFNDETPLGEGLSNKLYTHFNIFSFDVPYILTMPGTVWNPGTGIIKDGTIHYQLTGERLIPGDYVITATSRVTHIWAYVVTLLIILLPLAVSFYRRKK
ncbi:MAG: hypothetical protein IJ635_02300 [Bacteroidaceae bacterium]|nr:hypothetical protein [Bacteroidaceae bacterium]